jgi:type II secretory pathway pseudopilin PulG
MLEVVASALIASIVASLGYQQAINAAYANRGGQLATYANNLQTALERYGLANMTALNMTSIPQKVTLAQLKSANAGNLNPNGFGQETGTLVDGDDPGIIALPVSASPPKAVQMIAIYRSGKALQRPVLSQAAQQIIFPTGYYFANNCPVIGIQPDKPCLAGPGIGIVLPNSFASLKQADGSPLVNEGALLVISHLVE